MNGLLIKQRIGSVMFAFGGRYFDSGRLPISQTKSVRLIKLRGDSHEGESMQLFTPVA
jgi:hypothetical protein